MTGIRIGELPLGVSDDNSNVVFEAEDGKAARERKSNFEQSAVSKARDYTDSVLQGISAGAPMFPSIEDGMAGTSEGEFFNVAGVAGGDTYQSLYRHDPDNVAFDMDLSAPSRAAVEAVEADSMRDYSPSSGREWGFSDISRMVAQQTMGGSIAPLTFARNPVRGLDVSSTSGTRYYVMSTDFSVQRGVFVAQADVFISEIAGSNLSFGLAVGEQGASRRMYVYRSDGAVQIVTDSESVVGVSTASIGQSFSAGDSVSLRIEVQVSSGTGAIIIKNPAGEESRFSISSFPKGPVWVVIRGIGSLTYDSLQVEGYSESARAAIERAGAPQISDVERKELFAMGEFLAPLEVRLPPDFSGYQKAFKIYRRGDRTFFTDLNFDDLKPFPESSADTVYYVSQSGDDSNPGTQGAPFRSLRRALHGGVGNVLVIVEPGNYFGADSWNDANPTMTGLIVRPSIEGRIVSSNHIVGLTWSLSSGQSATFQATAASVSAVADASDLTDDGDYTRLTLVASVAEVESTPGSYWHSAGIVYVHTHDAREPDTDLRVWPSTRNGRYQVAGGTAWVSGVDFEGGARSMQQACLDVESSNTAVFVDCTFKYSGAGRNGFSSDGWCYTFMRDCVASGNEADGFNYHNFNGSPPPASVEISCVGRHNGYNSNGTNNGSTTHDGGTVIRLNGRYYGNQNRNVHDVGGATSWNLGCVAKDSRSDNNVNFAAGVGALDSTLMWLDQCDSEGSEYDYQTSADSVIRLNGPIDEGRLAPGSVVETYRP